MESYTNLTDREREKYLDSVVFKGWERDFQTCCEYAIYLDLWMAIRPVRPTRTSWYKLKELLEYTEGQVTEEDVEALVERGVIRVKKIQGRQYVWFTPINMLLSKKKKPEPKRTCVICGSELKGSQKKYCSPECARKARGLKPKRTTCLNCGGKLPRRRSKFCSSECREEYYR